MKYFLTTLFFGILFSSSAQLDSAAIVSVQNKIVQVVDSSGVAVNDTLIELKVYVNDFDFLGDVLCYMTHQETQYPLHMAKFTKSQIESSGTYNQQNSNVTIQLPRFDVSGNVIIRLVVRNYQGASYPYLDTIYNL